MVIEVCCRKEIPLIILTQIVIIGPSIYCLQRKGFALFRGGEDMILFQRFLSAW